MKNFGRPHVHHFQRVGIPKCKCGVKHVTYQDWQRCQGEQKKKVSGKS